ncbi:MAG: PTS sugar transporter subunit IIA [Candidatus Cloacimonadales bacterium]
MWKDKLDKKLIVIDPEVSSKSELFAGMVDHVYQYDYLTNKKKFLNALKKREELSNTELIPTIAIPHARSDYVDKLFLCIILLKEGIDYGNSEFGKVKIVFFFGCSEAHNKEYLQLLAKSSRLLKNQEFRDSLLACQTADEVVDVLVEYDEEDDSNEKDDHHLLLLTLHNGNQVADVMEALVETGITNASIIDSQSMVRKMAYEMPVFAGLSYMAHGKSASSALIFAHIERKAQAEQLLKLLKDYKIDLNKKGVGFLQVIKLETVLGDYEEDLEI